MFTQEKKLVEFGQGRKLKKIIQPVYNQGCDFVKQTAFLPSQKAQCPKVKIFFQQKNIGRA